jgi:ABC-type polysaccharide/polyol phosphate transport system ATPase subunit
MSYRGGNKFWALKDISFDVKKGECVGVIGDNGSGKSTLLKIITGITLPSEGNVIANGKMGHFLELGIGFQGDLSGKENIFLYGSLLGLKRESLKKVYKEIIDFSELKEVIEQPIKTYSSGMLARLAFSVLASTDLDVLLLDEVVSVGDYSFKRKSLNKIMEFKRKGKTILIVSHNLSDILKICDKCILLEKGQIVLFDDAKKVVEAYVNKANQKNKIKLITQIKEEFKNHDTAKLLYLYNELDTILESMIKGSKEKIIHHNQGQDIKTIHKELVTQCEERLEALKKMLDYYENEGSITQSSILYKNMIETMNCLIASYENLPNENKSENAKKITLFKEQMKLLKKMIKSYTYSDNNSEIIKIYGTLTQTGLKISEIKKDEKELVLSHLRQVLKKGLKKAKNSEEMLALIIKVTGRLAKISKEKEKRKKLYEELKNYNKQYHNLIDCNVRNFKDIKN